MIYEVNRKLLHGVASATYKSIPSTKLIARHFRVVHYGFLTDLYSGILGILPSLNLHLELRLHHHYRSPAQLSSQFDTRKTRQSLRRYTLLRNSNVEALPANPTIDGGTNVVEHIFSGATRTFTLELIVVPLLHLGATCFCLKILELLHQLRIALSILSRS